jgi:GLPGLI family protein
MKTIKILFLFLYSILFSQNHDSNNNLTIVYDAKLMYSSMYATLSTLDEKSVFFFSKYDTNAKDQLYKTEKVDINPYYFYIYDSNDDTFYQSFSYAAQDHYGHGGLSSDNFALPIWKIENERKSILGFSCRKAKTKFRGKEFEVWFTTELNENIFPWKFKGLPGVILSYSDNEKMFSGTAISIVQNKPIDINFIQRINQYFNKYKKSAIPYRNEINIIRKWEELMIKKSLANEKNGSGTTSQEFLRLEKSFDWENPKIKE